MKLTLTMVQGKHTISFIVRGQLKLVSVDSLIGMTDRNFQYDKITQMLRNAENSRDHGFFLHIHFFLVVAGLFHIMMLRST